MASGDVLHAQHFKPYVETLKHRMPDHQTQFFLYVTMRNNKQNTPMSCTCQGKQAKINI